MKNNHYSFEFPVEQNESNIKIFPRYSGGAVVAWSFSIDGKDSNKVAESADMAYLLALEEKYLGINEKFAGYVAKILNIKSVWSSK